MDPHFEKVREASSVMNEIKSSSKKGAATDKERRARQQQNHTQRTN